MDVGLPRETQQIDRVMEAFAARYRQCNPSLFVSDGASLDLLSICCGPVPDLSIKIIHTS